MENNQKKEEKSNPYLNFIMRDFLYIIVIIFALGACIYTLLYTDHYVGECENKYITYINNNCECSKPKLDFNFSITENGNKDKDTNT